MNFIDLILHGSAVLIVLLGILVLVGGTRERNNWIFFFWSLSTGGWIQSVYWGFYFASVSDWELALLGFRFAFFFGSLVLAFMTMFFYYFPRILIPIKKLWRVIFALATITVAVISLTDLVHESLVIENGEYVTDTFGAGYLFYTVFVLFNYAASLLLAFKKYFRGHGIERQKLAYATFGSFVFIFSGVLVNLILPLMGIIIFELQRLIPLASLTFSIPAYIALSSVRFFNLSYLSLKLARKLLLYSSYLLIIYVFYEAFLVFSPQGNRLLLGTISIVLSLAFLEKIQASAPEFLSLSFRTLRDTMKVILTKLNFCDSFEELRSLIEKHFLLELNYEHAAVFVVRNKGATLHLDVYPRDDFTKELATYKKDLLVSEEIQFSKKSEKTKALLRDTMKRLKADLCMPLFSEANLIGFLVLRKNKDDRSFAQEEVQEIQSIKRSLEVTLMNLLLKTNLVEENNLMKSIIDKKTKQLKKKIEEINDLLKQQSDFIAVTAHEFRTPLSVAMFQLEEVMESKKPEEELVEDLKVIDSSLENLKDLTQKLFTVQQYDLNKVEMHQEKISIRDFVKEIYSDFSVIMKGKRIDFSLEFENKDPLQVSADKAQLRQVLHNILNNAYKFTPENEKVGIDVSSDDKHVVVKISDSGEGIPDELKTSIFDKFRTKTAGSGIGLGLYLCKKIIELHEGKIWVEDSPLGGASFCVKLKKVT